jgi:hypothetical protein
VNVCAVLGRREFCHSVCQVASLCEHSELHNTSDCHHVSLHICDFSMDVKLEQTANIKFCVKLGRSGAETFEMIRRAYGNKAMSRGRCFKWHAHFKRGRTSLEEDGRSGRPSTSSTPKNAGTVQQLLHEDRWRTIKDIAAIVNVSYGTLQTILTCDLSIHSLVAMFVPRLLTPNRKSTVLQFVKSFVGVPWITYPLCRGSLLGTRVGYTGMIPRLCLSTQVIIVHQIKIRGIFKSKSE